MEDRNKLLIKIGDNIRKARLSLGLSQEEIAFRADLYLSYYGKIERGEHNASIINLLKISLALKTPLSELLPPLEFIKKNINIDNYN